MNLHERKRQLIALYEDFERKAAPYMAQAVCVKGCADCCIEVGAVTATTLEGLIIQQHLKGWGREESAAINRKLRQNRSEKLTKVFVRCAFLDEHQCCRIYPVRPFSCRRLYSVKTCGEHGPVIHRQALDLAQQTIQALQDLDPAGCSGHLSFILHVLDRDGFRRAYLKGTLDPRKFRGLIERFQLTVNADDSREAKPRSPVSG